MVDYTRLWYTLLLGLGAQIAGVVKDFATEVVTMSQRTCALACTLLILPTTEAPNIPRPGRDVRGEAQAKKSRDWCGGLGPGLSEPQSAVRLRGSLRLQHTYFMVRKPLAGPCSKAVECSLRDVLPALFRPCGQSA